MSPHIPDLTIVDPASSGETVFAKMLSQYRQLCVRAEDMIVQLVCGEVESGLRAHRMAATT